MNLDTVWGYLHSVQLWVAIAIYVALSLFAVLLLRSLCRSAVQIARQIKATDNAVTGTRLFYTAAVAGMAVSVDTSWNFFGVVLNVDNLWARGIMFFVLELAQLACGQGMRASIRQHGTPGPARLIAWALCAVSAYMAWSLSGFWVGIARVLLGPILSLVMLHLALGIEVRGLKVRQDSMWVRLARELRERFLALFGLGDEGRDAKAIIRERALAKASQIRMTGDGSKRSQRRFIKALVRADIANDPAAFTEFVNEMRLSANASKIWGLDFKMLDGFETAVETETPSETSAAETETVDETETETTQVNTGETTETALPAVSLTRRSGKAEAEIETLLQLMAERGNGDAVSLKDVMQLLGLSKATADRRLRIARERFTQAS